MPRVKRSAKTPYVEDIYVHFGAALSAHRIKANLTQQQLADATGYSKASISNIETGRQRLYLPDAIRLAAAVNAQLEDLLPKTED